MGDIKTMPHLLLCANTTWSLYNFRHGLITTLLEKGFVISILAPKDECSDKLEAMGCQIFDLHMSAKGVNPFADFVLMTRIALFYRRLKPDFIIHYTIKPNIYGTLAARLTSIPSLAVTTGLGYTFLNNNLVAKIARQLYKLAFNFPEEIWFLNADDKHAFLRHNLVDKNKAIILRSEGINTAHFTSLPKPLNDGKFRFLLIARMLWDKGIGEYVEAARKVRARHPNAVFQLLGATGVPNPSVIGREQIAEWEAAGDVEYLGTTDDVRSIIAQADCVVLPSYREGVPRTLMEAAAMGKPLITTDTAGCRDVVHHEQTGLLCPLKDSHALANSMELMLNMCNEKREAMGAAGRSFMIENFEEQKVISQYLQMLDKYVIQSEIEKLSQPLTP